MSRLLDLIREAWQDNHKGGVVLPWYRRPNMWLVAAAVVLPFGWLLPIARVAYVEARNRRAARCRF
jgi:hypothetical protein